MKLRDYQVDAVNAMRKSTTGICVAPAGSGKTVIAAELVSKCVQDLYFNGNLMPSVLWLAHTQEQVQQGKDACERLAADGFVDIEFACYASNPAIRHDIVIIDECHWAGAESVRRMVNRAREVSMFVYGFTATPKREDGVDITTIIGDILYTVARQQVQDVGGVIPAEVRVIPVGAVGDIDELVDETAKAYYNNRLRWCDQQTGSDEQWKRCQYRAALNIGIRENRYRDAVIARLAGSHSEDSVIVLVDSKEHGKRLESIIDRSKFVASGVRGRKSILDGFKDGVLKCVISTAILDEGFDACRAGVLIMAGSGKAFGKVVQRTGRVLRPHEGKDKGIIYDFKDLGHGMLTAQHWMRRRVYKSVGYSIREYRVEQ